MPNTYLQKGILKMKKVLSLLLVLGLALNLSACNNSGDEKASNKDTNVDVAQSSATKVALGEVASTDILDVTLENAEFAFYAENTLNDTYLTPTDDTDTIYSASKGNCLVIITFTMTNKDRGGSINFNNGDDTFEWELKYGEETFNVKGFDLNINKGSDTLDFAPSSIIDRETGKFIESHSGSNYILSAGETVTLKVLGIINTEPKSLNDGFDLTVDIPDFNGEYESFTYTIPAK